MPRAVHGPVRIGDLQILENTVLQLPDNELIIDDGATIGPGTMIHGSHIGTGTVVEPGAIVCDGSVVGAGCVVRAGAVVKQLSPVGDGVEIDGAPAVVIGPIATQQRPPWALSPTTSHHPPAARNPNEHDERGARRRSHPCEPTALAHRPSATGTHRLVANKPTASGGVTPGRRHSASSSAASAPAPR